VFDGGCTYVGERLNAAFIEGGDMFTEDTEDVLDIARKVGELSDDRDELAAEIDKWLCKGGRDAFFKSDVLRILRDCQRELVMGVGVISWMRDEVTGLHKRIETFERDTLNRLRDFDVRLKI